MARTVCVVEDDASLRRGLGRLLESADYKVALFDRAATFLAAPPPPPPACLVLDVKLPGINGLELQRELLHSERALPIVFITGAGDVPMCADAMKGGAVDFLPKPFDDEALLEAIERALARAVAEEDARREYREARARIDKLTPREFEVLKQVINGKPNKLIAAELGTVEQTIKVHRGRMMEKLGVSSVPALIRIAHTARVK